MATTTPFDPGRHRDAWATVRGYVYQVDVTVDRWLDLGEDEVLELERGEDVDLLGRAAAVRGAERERLLEQVKHLDSSITLRSGAVRAFLANAHAHRKQNPSLRLRFRFTTTARPGLERPTAMPQVVPGVVAWEQIRVGSWPAVHLPDALAAIRELLTSASTPEGLPEETWASFQAFIGEASNAELERFVQACEWSPHHVPAGDYEAQLHARLVAMGLAPDLSVAGSLYDRLLAFVFRRLTQPGLKRLTRAELFEQVSHWREGVPLSPEDDQRVRELREIVRRLEARMDVVESAVSDLKVVTASSAAAIDRMARQQGIAAAIAYVASVPVLDEPPAVERASARTDTVAHILERRGSATWLALHGISGIGKSQLALLLGRQIGDERVWIRFRDLDVPQACVRLDAALAQLAGRPALRSSGGGDIVKDQRGALAAVGRGAVVVLDDLPRYHSGDEFGMRLVSLVRAAAEEGVLVLSTSPFRAPSVVLDSFAHGQVLSIPSPPFTVEEVREVLEAHGAPERWQDQSLALLVHTVTRGHPTLVRACARDLASRGWAADTSALTRVLGAEFAAGVNDETIRALLDSAPDPAARELLFRLNLVDGEFGIDEVQLLAGIAPAISGPRSQLDALLGVWVQTDTGGQYVVSPLVRPLGGSELAPETRRGCHRVLGQRIVSGQVMGDLKASRALTHFIGAEEYDSAGWILIRGLVALREVDLFPGVLPVFSHAWLTTPLPGEMNLGLRIQVRALQLGLCVRSGRDVGYVRGDLDGLLADVGNSDDWVVFTAAMFASEALASVDVESAGRYLLRALRLRSTVLGQLEERGLAAPKMPLEQMVWVLSTGIDSPAGLEGWLDVLEAMTPEERTTAFEPEDVGRSGALHVANKLMFNEQEKAPDERDWSAVMASLRSLTDRAREMDLEVLADAALLARMTIHAEFLGDLTAAEELSEDVLARPGLDRASAFLITNTRALLLYDYGPAERTAEWLSRAFALRTPVYGWQSVRAGIYLSMRVAESEPQRAVEVLTEATEFADEHPNEVGLARVEAYGERALAEWFAGDAVAAFRSWDRAATLLLEMKDDSSSWKSVFVAFGHITGYLYSVASSGQPPTALEGGEPYAAPSRGLFVLRPEGRDEAFSEDRMQILPVQLALFADAVAAYDRAAVWARSAEAMCKAAGSYQAVALVLPVLVAEAVAAADYERVIDLAREKWAIWEANRIRGTFDVSVPTRPPEEVLGPEGGEPWLPVESSAMLALVAVYFDLALLARQAPDEARARLRGLTGVLRAHAKRSVDPDAWEAAANLFEAIFMDNVPERELVARGNGYAFRDESSSKALRIVAYLGASVRPDTTPERSLGLQLALAIFVERMVLRETRAFAEVAGRYLKAFWRERFDAARFRFSNPREVERLLDRARAGSDQFRLVLAAVTFGLRPPISAELRRWLNAPPGAARDSSAEGTPSDGSESSTDRPD